MKMNNEKNNITVVLVVSILISFVCGMIGSYLMIGTMSPGTKTTESIIKNITTSELVETSISTSVDKVYDRTVFVISLSKGKQVSTGTGFIYKIENGKAYIMTNNHVIDGGDTAKVEFNDNDKQYEVTIVGGDTYSDIAVLTLDLKKAGIEVEAVEVGKSVDAKLGDTVFTVGAPMGINYKGTVTKGIISGLERLVEVSLSNTSSSDYYLKVLQIDAAVNPGNSGGPLCDVSGKVIGIISLKIVQDEVEGMGFAIPIEDALEQAKLLEEGGEVIRPFVGISMLDLSNDFVLYQNRITVPEGITKGVAVLEVVSGSPADKAKLQKGDIIVSIGDSKVGSIAEFRYELYKHKVGDKVEITYYRDNKMQKTTITLGKNNEQ
ncbi:MAG: serine protease [Bacilli bacterium]|nr:serine protease [Bacilli bacterium]